VGLAGTALVFAYLASYFTAMHNNSFKSEAKPALFLETRLLDVGTALRAFGHPSVRQA
jgi:hypothetical protein